jgi:hypothetical protein
MGVRARLARGQVLDGSSTQHEYVAQVLHDQSIICLSLKFPLKRRYPESINRSRMSELEGPTYF